MRPNEPEVRLQRNLFCWDGSWRRAAWTSSRMRCMRRWSALAIQSWTLQPLQDLCQPPIFTFPQSHRQTPPFCRWQDHLLVRLNCPIFYIFPIFPVLDGYHELFASVHSATQLALRARISQTCKVVWLQGRLAGNEHGFQKEHVLNKNRAWPQSIYLALWPLKLMHHRGSTFIALSRRSEE